MSPAASARRLRAGKSEEGGSRLESLPRESPTSAPIEGRRYNSEVEEKADLTWRGLDKCQAGVWKMGCRGLCSSSWSPVASKILDRLDRTAYGRNCRASEQKKSFLAVCR